jgi:hypothetical protein
MDPNIPNPSRTVRVMDEDAFCQKWGEKMSDTMILRRPAMLVSLEVTPGGRQVVASSIPMPKIITEAPRRFQKGDGGEAAWGRLKEDIISGFENDAKNPEDFMRTMGPWDAGYQRGITPDSDREAVQHYMSFGSLVLSLSHHYGYGVEAEREWKLGFEAGRKHLEEDEGHKVAKKTTEVRGPKRDPNKIIIPDDAIRRTPRLGPEAVTTRRKTRFEDKTLYDRKPKRRDSYE